MVLSSSIFYAKTDLYLLGSLRMGLRSRIKEFYWLEAFIISFITGGFWFFADNPKLIPNIQLPSIPIIQSVSLSVSIISLAIGLFLLYFQMTTFTGSERSQDSQENLSEGTKKEVVEGDSKTADVDLYADSSNTDSTSQLNSNPSSNNKPDTRDNSDDVVERDSSDIIDPYSLYGDVFWLNKDGEVIIETKDGRHTSSARKILIFLIGKRHAYEAGLIDSPHFTASEIAENCNLARSTVYKSIDDISEYLSINQKGRVSEYSVELKESKRALLRVR